MYAFPRKRSLMTEVLLCRTKMVYELHNSGVVIDKLEVVHSKSQLEQMLQEEQYDILICMDRLGNEKVGRGRIRSWRVKYPQMQVVLVIGKERKGGGKLTKFVTQEPYYYDAIYQEELSGEFVAEILRNPRSKDAAIEYYGVQNIVDNVRDLSKVYKEGYDGIAART